MFNFPIALNHGMLWPALHGLPARDWLIICCVLLVGGIVKGVVSIGVPLVAIPLLTGFVSVKQAVLLLSLPIVLGNIPQALEGGNTGRTLKGIGFLVAGAVLGIAVGVRILLSIPSRTAVLVAGIVLAGAALLMLLNPKFTLPKRGAAPAGFGIGFGSGLMEGIAAVPGPLLAAYLIAAGSTGKRFTKEIALVLVISVAALILVFNQSHHASASDLLISALASVPVVAGIILGRPLRDALPPRRFRMVVLVCILLAAAQMIYRSQII